MDSNPSDPAAEIPRIAAGSGATVIQVNPQPTPLGAAPTIDLPGNAGEVLPALVAAAWGAPAQSDRQPL